MFDIASLNDAELVARLASGERLIAVTQAQQIALTAELHRRAPEWITRADPSCPGMDPAEVTAAEIGPALRISRRAASDRVHFALTVLSRLPASVAALAAGALSLTKLRMIAEHTAVLDDPACAAVEAQVLVRAGQQTPGGLGVSLARAVLAADPAAAERRHAAAVAERRVDFYPAEDGMSILRALLSAPDALRAHRALTDAAKASGAKHAGHSADTTRAAVGSGPGAAEGGSCPETLDSRRADLFLSALLGLDTPSDANAATDRRSKRHASEGGASKGHPSEGHPSEGHPSEGHPSEGHPSEGGESKVGHGKVGATNETDDHRQVPDAATKPASRRSANGPAAIRVTVPWTTLAGLDDQPGQLHGYGAITADTVRRLAADATWTRLLTDPATGAVLDVGTTTYSPPAALDRHVRSRDVSCRFPGCRQPADRADLDHTRPYPAGPTSAANLAALCRPDHRLKTLTRWRVEQHPDGTLRWTSPTGQRYDTHPPPTHPLLRPLSRALPPEPHPPPLPAGHPLVEATAWWLELPPPVESRWDEGQWDEHPDAA